MSDPRQTTDSETNPLLKAWVTPFATPPFDEIVPEHFLPAFEQAFADHSAEIAAITNDPAAADFANTVTALERSGKLLNKVASVFYDLVSAHSNPAILDIDKEVSLRMARHWNPIMMNAVLFGRIAQLHENRANLGLTPEQLRLLERTYTRFHRAGAGLSDEAKTRMAEINEKLAQLATGFSHHLLGDEQDWFMELGEADRQGLPESFVAAAKAAAEDRGMAGKAVVTLSRSSAEPFLKSSARRDLREKVYKAFTARGDNGNSNDNNTTIGEILKLREESAKLLGYPTFAAYRLEDSMAKTPDAVRGLLERVWKPARARALADRDEMQALITEEGGNFKLAPWDWRFYAEKLRLQRANFDDAAIKPYLTLDHMIAASFDCATRLFGVTFEERKDVPVWHPDVRVWEVKGPDGKHKALFYGDYYARPSKRSGAWMTSLRDQQKLDGEIAPLVINVCNFAKGTGTEPSLLSPDDARTLFHEFGHGLHGMLSNVTYPSLSGTSVFTDFVELPSQLYEHWQERPEVLQQFARHYQTGEPLPDDLLKRFLAARKFNQGFATVEFVSSALVDLEFHSQPAAAAQDVRAFEKKELEKIGMPEEISMRHRPTQFGHIFSGDHYAAGYYSYMWSEVMDADAFGAFEEAGNIFDPAVAKRLHDDIYSSGGSVDPEAAYEAFRGRPPEPDALLRRRGLLDEKGGLTGMRALLGWLLAAAMMLASGAASAHPHVWITATSELLYAEDGSITGVRHAWTFDDMFSAYAVQGLESKKKGAYTREELGPLAQTNVESLKEYAYFTFAKADGKKERFTEPVDYFLDYKDTVLTLHFTLPLKTPLKPKQLVLEVFDRSFFIDFQMAKDNPVKLVGAPSGCQMKLDRPSDGTATAQKLNEQTFMDGPNANFGMMFANKITVDCP